MPDIISPYYNPKTGAANCSRCAHVWTAKPAPAGKFTEPKACAKCKSTGWNKPRVYAGKYISGVMATRHKPTGRQAAKLDSINKKYDWYVVGLSSGKDSTALLLWLLNEFKIDPDKLICTFCDTGNEADQVYTYIDKISRELHPVITLTPRLNFYELAHYKKRMPDFARRFCTEHLKLIPHKEFCETLNGKILTINGVRADESDTRSTYKEFVSWGETFSGFDEWRPLLRWKVEDVWLIHKRYNFPRNPLYDLGFDRVGCMPCIMSKKEEIKLFAQHFPQRVDKIREFERSFPNRNGFYQFFPLNTTPDRFKTTESKNAKGQPLMLASIDDIVLWSQTQLKRSKKQMLLESECKAGFCE